MAKVSHTGLTGSPLVRLFAQLAGREVRPSKLLMSDRLSQWLSWTDAIALSAALEGSGAAVSSGPPVAGGVDEAEVARVRATLVTGISSMSSDLGSQEAVKGGTLEFAPYRQKYLSRQQSMEIAIETLRARLRTTLAARSAALGRLAALDAVMAQVLGGREQGLLSSLPGLLEAHFQRLRQAAQAVESVGTAGPNDALAWLGVFCQDMKALLLAELDLRFQPVEGLIEALRTTPSGHHE